MTIKELQAALDLLVKEGTDPNMDVIASIDINECCHSYTDQRDIRSVAVGELKSYSKKKRKVCIIEGGW